MKLNTYQKRAMETRRTEAIDFQYATLEICGEAGELAETRKKWIRGDFKLSEYRDKTKLELGDILWGVANLADLLGLDLDEVAEANLKKLSNRAQENTIGGPGAKNRKELREDD